MSLEIPGREIVSYVSKFGAAAIAGISSDMPPCAIGAATDIGRVLGMIRARWPKIFPDDIVLLAAWWGDCRQVRRWSRS
jgi:hypothetical protein